MLPLGRDNLERERNIGTVAEYRRTCRLLVSRHRPNISRDLDATASVADQKAGAFPNASTRTRDDVASGEIWAFKRKAHDDPRRSAHFKAC